MTTWLSPAQQQAWKGYLDSRRLLHAALERQLARTCGLSFADYEVLVALSEAPNRTARMSELADSRQSTRSGMTRAVARLELLGYVVRTKRTDDGRGTDAHLTDIGFEILAAAAPGHVDEVRENLFDLLTPNELATLTRINAKVIAKLGTSVDHPE